MKIQASSFDVLPDNNVMCKTVHSDHNDDAYDVNLTALIRETLKSSKPIIQYQVSSPSAV